MNTSSNTPLSTSLIELLTKLRGSALSLKKMVQSHHANVWRFLQNIQIIKSQQDSYYTTNGWIH